MPNSKANPFSGGYKYMVVGKIGDFDGNRRLSRKRCEISRWLLWNVNRKSWLPDRTVSFSMTLSDRKLGFQGQYILTSRISQKRCVLRTELLKNTNRKPYTIYQMVPLSMALSNLWPGFKVTIFSDIEYLRNDTRYSHDRTSIGSRMRSIEWWYFQWPWRTPNPVFKVTAFLRSNIGKTARLKDKVTIAQEETIPNIWNGTIFGDLDWPLNALRGFVSISWASCVN